MVYGNMIVKMEVRVMDYKKDVSQDDIVDSATGFTVSFGFFLLMAVLFTIISVLQK